MHVSLVSSVLSITGTQFRQFRRLQEPSFIDYRKPVSSVLFRQFRFVDHIYAGNQFRFVSFVLFRQLRFVDYRKSLHDI